MSRVFDASASWIPAQLKKPVKEAIEAGWTPGKDRIKAGGWFLYSPKKTEKFYIPITCKDPDNVAKKLRALISKAYLTEKNAFEPDMPRNMTGEVNGLVHLSTQAVLDGAIILPGPVPSIRCPDCDLEFTGWDAFAAHQEPCRERVRARLAAEQAALVPEEGDKADSPSEDVLQSVTDSTEPVHSGIIGTKEETPLADESNTGTPERRATTPSHDPKTGRKRGYTWTRVNGKEDPLHEVLYEAVRYTRRFKNETDSKYTLRLSQYIETEGLLDRLAFADPDMQATATLDKIRELLGGGEAQGTEEDALTIKQLEDSVAEKTTEIETLKAKVTNLRGVLDTLSSLAKETDE